MLAKSSASLLAIFVATAGLGVASPQTPGTLNSNFIINNNNVLLIDTAIQPVGPYEYTGARGSNPLRWSTRVSAPAGVSPISVHALISSGLPATGWELRFQAVGPCTIRCSDSISSDSSRGAVADAWSDDIGSNVVDVMLVADKLPKSLSITIDEYDYPIVPVVPQGIFGKANLEYVSSTPADVQKLASAVGRLRIKTSRGQALCTGFLISDSLLLTNFHCISSSTEAASARVDFGIDRDNEAGQSFWIQDLEVVNSDLAYDYVLARVLKAPGKTFGHISVPSVGSVFFPQNAPAPGSLAFPNPSQQLLVIEYPGGGVKKVSRDSDCAVVDDKISGVDGQILSDFSHRCDTLGGSSGSPVFARDTNALVGLHHMGFTETSTPVDSLENQAVYIGYILEDIRHQSSALFGEITAPNTR